MFCKPTISVFLIKIICFIFAKTSFAQTLPFSSQQAEMPIMLNPAAYPVEYMLDEDFTDWFFSGAYRQQWRDIEGPVWANARADWLQKRDGDERAKLAAGAQIHMYNTDPIRQLNGTARVAACIPITKKKWRISGGLSAGYQAYQMDIAKMVALHPDDPVLATALPSSSRISAGLGLFAYYKPGDGYAFWGGASVPQMSWPLKYGQPQAVGDGFCKGLVYNMLGGHLLLYPGKGKEVQAFYAEPVIQNFLEQGHPMIMDASLKVGFQNDKDLLNFWLRGGYANNKRWRAECGFQIPGLFESWLCKFMFAYYGFSPAFRGVAPNAMEVGFIFYRLKG